MKNQSSHFSKKSTTSVELNLLNQVLSISESWDEAKPPPSADIKPRPAFQHGHLASGGDAKVNLIP